MGLAALGRFTESEYEEMEAKADYRSEYFNGEIFAMAGGTPRHSILCGSMIRCVGNAVNGNRCHVMDCNMRIRIPTGLQTYPDMSVVCGEIKLAPGRTDCMVNPLLVVEVLSKSTESYDRGEKFTNYKTLPSLREYVLVSQTEPLIEVFRRGKTGRWTETMCQGLDATIRFDSVGASINLVDVYRGIDFDTP